MTRINVIEPAQLSRQHLIAEYREIARLPKNLRDSLNRKSTQFSFDEIPKDYTLGKGHVKFFYDKMYFLQKRFELLVAEMLRRGYSANFQDSGIFLPENKIFYNDYTPTQAAIEINLQRIKERTKE